MKSLILFIASKDLSGSADQFYKVVTDYESAKELADKIHKDFPRRLIELKVFVPTRSFNNTGYRGGCEFYSARGEKYSRPYLTGTLDVTKL
jgi:hypothetical protein